jgi:hypothetical protein
MGVAEEAGKVGTAAIESMKSAPLAIALLLVNLGFIGFNGYILSAVASNASERNKTQMDLIAKLADDVRDCSRQGAKTNSLLRLYPPPPTLPISGR